MAKALSLCGATPIACGTIPARAQFNANANAVAETGTPLADTPEQARGPSRKPSDNTVAESRRRIIGVAIDRSGGEGQFITVRGLGLEFNYGAGQRPHHGHRR